MRVRPLSSLVTSAVPRSMASSGETKATRLKTRQAATLEIERIG
jgi:hypothetical protein